MRSPLKNLDNHKNTLSYLKKIIPQRSVLDSFLFFDGYLEFNLCENNIFINAHTNRFVIYEFWLCMMNDGHTISELIKSDQIQRIKDKEAFHILQESWAKYRDPYIRSAFFFMLNRCSERGLISSGGFDVKRLNPVSINHLKNFHANNFHLSYDTNETLISSIEKASNSNLLLMPMGKFSLNLFEHGKSLGLEQTLVHHKKLNLLLSRLNKRWILLYKNHPGVYSLYKNNKLVMIDEYGNITNDKSACEDIVVTNF